MTKYLFFVLVLSITCLTLVSLHELDEERPGGSYVYRNTRPSQMGNIPQWDPNGYVLFCLCMGRSGNQIEHLLGGMAFAKAINRTLILPPFRTYRNVRFTEWFKFEPMAEFHRVVLAEDFLEFLAPTHWPPGKRLGFCWKPPMSPEKDCKMKEGNPFASFWDGLGVNFDGSIVYELSYYESDMVKWPKVYPASEYPVLAMRGAPAPYPMARSNRHLQRYLEFSDRVTEEAQKYIDNHFPNERYVGIHLRNGPDWVNACTHAVGEKSYMASYQCLEDTSDTVTKELCDPPTSEVLRLTKNIVLATRAKVVFVATDKNPLIEEIQEHLSYKNVTVFHADPWLPLIDWAILAKSDHFIGNCVSSFTSFVKRARDVEGRPTSFWGRS